MLKEVNYNNNKTLTRTIAIVIITNSKDKKIQNLNKYNNYS